MALFVHANVLHLVGNMLFPICLWKNPGKERRLRQILLAIFFTGGFLSFIVSARPFCLGALECWGPRPQFSRWQEASCSYDR